MLKTIDNLEKTTKGFKRFHTPVNIDELKVIAIGYYPYETAKVTGVRVARDMFMALQLAVFKSKFISDNKITYVCRNMDSFESDDFALHVYSNMATLGSIDSIEEY